MSLRTRILLALAVLLVLPFAGFLVWTAMELRPRVRVLSTEALESEARLVAELVGEASFSDSLADRLGAVVGRRVTLIGRDGGVLGDSDVPAARLPRVPSHAGRPEVQAALSGRTGSAVRASATVNRSLLYVAVPHPRGVIRVSRPTDPADRLYVRAMRLGLVAGAATLLLAFLLTPFLAGFVSSSLRGVRRTVESLGVGDLTGRVEEPEGGGEVGRLGRAVNAMAGRLEEAVAALREERDDLDALFESLDDGLAVIDADGSVVRANPAFARWAGRRDVRDRRVSTLFRSPDLVAAVDRGLAARSDTREVVLGQRTALVAVQPHHEGALVMLHDLTRLRRLEGVRRDFVANVSHELKTPLTSVVGFAEALGSGDLSLEEAREFGRRILTNARRMRRLVDDLLDLARIESGHWAPKAERVEVSAVAHAVWASLQPAPRTRVVRLSVDEAPPVAVDPDALRQILRNLFDNALRYVPDGSEVRVRQRVEDGEVRISVADSGPGVPSAHHARIFERFYRVDAARSRAAGGTGLGLAIVKHLVTAHGGRVGVESEPGQGTIVWFTLPAAEPALVA